MSDHPKPGRAAPPRGLEHRRRPRRDRQAPPARLAAPRHVPRGAARRASSSIVFAGSVRGRPRRLHGQRRAALRHLGRLPPGHLGPAGRRRPPAVRPLEHLPHHRRHLHAVRRAAAGRRRPAGAPDHLGRRPRRRALPRLLGRRAPLALHAALHRARLGRRLLRRPVLARGGPRSSAPSSAGALYTAARIVYGTKRPNPWPRWFGFHEVFHAFTLGLHHALRRRRSPLVPGPRSSDRPVPRARGHDPVVGAGVAGGVAVPPALASGGSARASSGAVPSSPVPSARGAPRRPSAASAGRAGQARSRRRRGPRGRPRRALPRRAPVAVGHPPQPGVHVAHEQPQRERQDEEREEAPDAGPPSAVGASSCLPLRAGRRRRS